MNKMKTLRFFLTFGLVIVLTISVTPARHASAQGGVTASAVAAPAQVSKLGFVASGLVKEVFVKEGDQVKAGDVLITLDAPELQYAVTAAEAALRSAQGRAELKRYERVKNVRNGKVFWDELPGEILALANVQVTQAQAALKIAQGSLAQSIMVAPYDATIASISVVPGEYVEQNQVVVTLATLDILQLETTDLSERDITKVKAGSPVNILIEALNENINGTVIGVSPRANTVGGDVVYKVTIALDKQQPGLLWGMTAEVTIGK